MIEPGVYEHYKSTPAAPKRYRVLFVARWYDGNYNIGEPFTPGIDGPVSICMAGGLKVFPHSNGDSGFLEARWSGNSTSVVHEEPVVIYVALYDDGRVAARTLREFEERVDLMGGASVRRFERIGP